MVYLDSPTYDPETDRYTLYDNAGGSATFNITAATILGPTGKSYRPISKSGNIITGTYELMVDNLEIVSNNFSNDVKTLGAITIIPKIVTPKVSVPTKNYDGNRMIKNTIISIDGLIEGDDVKVVFTGLYDEPTAGTDLGYIVDDMILGGDDYINYMLSTTQINGADGIIYKIPLTIDVNDMTKVYDGKVNSVYTANYNGFIQGEDQFSLAGSIVASGTGSTAVTVGTYPYTISGLTSDNYTFYYLGGNVTISKAPISISGIKATNKVYDGTTLATADISNVVFEGIVTGETASISTTAVFESALLEKIKQ